MTRVVLALAIGLSVLPASAQVPAQDPQRDPEPTGVAEIRGRILSSGRGVPLADATVQATPLVPMAGRSRSVKTEDDGRFVLTGLQAGAYRLRVSLLGFVTTSFGAASANADPIVLGERDKVNRGDLSLPPGQSVSGIVLDADGKPLADATVQLLRTVYGAPGERRFIGLNVVKTSSTGAYRVSGLVPATYFVAATPDRATAPTYYPSTGTAAVAAPVLVRAGLDLDGIDIRIIDVPLARVSGRVVTPAGAPAIDQFVWLLPVRPDASAVASSRLTSEVKPDGTFMVRDVPPGDYQLEAIAKARLEAVAATGRASEAAGEYDSGSLAVTVDGTDVSDVLVTTVAPTSIAGVVTLDGKPLPAEVADPLSLGLTARVTRFGPSDVLQASTIPVDRAGRFSARLAPGGRRLRPYGLPAGVFLRRVLIDGVDVTDSGFDVETSGIRGMVVELTTTTTVLTGRLANAHGMGVPGASIVIFPTDSRRWSEPGTRRIKTARTSADGTFTIIDLPPGSYLAASAVELEDGEWASPASLERMRLRAKAFTIGTGERLTLTLTLQ